MSSNKMPLPVVVLCSSERSAEDWASRSRRYPDLEIAPVQTGGGAWRVVRQTIAKHDRPVAICQEHVWFGADFARAAGSLLAELDRGAANWAVCGNRGCTWDGGQTYNFSAFGPEPGEGLESARAPRVAFSLDDNLLLLNCARLREFDLVDLDVPSRIFGVLLSLECLRHKLALLADPRLFTVRNERHSAQDIADFVSAAGFQAYYRAHFVNHRYSWPDGDLDLSGFVDYSYISKPGEPHGQADLIDLFDDGLKILRGSAPSITLCCRTQFRRPELLRRALLSFAAAEIEARGSLKIEVKLITDREAGPDAPGADCWIHNVREPRYSRADLLLAAIERAQTDYIWFIDDDDYVLPGAAQALARTLVPQESTIVAGNARKMVETWLGQPPLLAENKLTDRLLSRHLYEIFSGANHIPICGFILPLEKVKPVLAGKKALGDYYEDYFILLNALCARNADVRLLDADLAAVSIRDGENTVSQTDRSHWNFSYATFMQEILCDPDIAPLYWQLGKNV